MTKSTRLLTLPIRLLIVPPVSPTNGPVSGWLTPNVLGVVPVGGPKNEIDVEVTLTVPAMFAWPAEVNGVPNAELTNRKAPSAIKQVFEMRDFMCVESLRKKRRTDELYEKPQPPEDKAKLLRLEL